jgi:hypothetical protein
VIQNHLFQVVALLAMEPPAGRDFGAVHNEKAKIFKLDSAKFSVGIRSACWPGGGWIVRWPDRSNGPSASS